jgi:GNAT superfamily N-acetyltransferase
MVATDAWTEAKISRVLTTNEDLTFRQAEFPEPDAAAVSRLLAEYLFATEVEKAAPGQAGADSQALPTRYRSEVDDPARALAGSTVLLAFTAGNPVGIVVVTGNEIKRLFVVEALRGAGIGSRLLDAALDRIRGAATLTVWEWRTSAIALYRRAGFEVTPSWDARPGLVCLTRPADTGVAPAQR